AFQTITNAIVDDFATNADRTFTLRLFNATSNGVPFDPLFGTPTNALVTIVNNDSVLSFSSTTYSVNENIVGGNAIITVSRLVSSTGPVTVNYTTANGTAT